MNLPESSIQNTESQASKNRRSGAPSARKALERTIKNGAVRRPEALELAEISDAVACRRLEPWAMLSALRRRLPCNRVSTCCRIPLPPTVRGVVGVQVLHRSAPAGQPGARVQVRYGNLGVCGNVWVCPVCAPRMARRRSAEIRRALTRHVAGGGRVMLVTLTHHHSRDGYLPEQLRLQAAALMHMQGTRSYRTLCIDHGVIGFIRALEVTHSRRAGWHVHLHLVVFLAGSKAQAEQHAVQMRQMDAAAPTRRAGKPVPDRAAVNVAQVRRLPKFGRLYVDAWCKAAETVGLHVRPGGQRAEVAGLDLATLERLADYLTKAGHAGARPEDNLAAFEGSATDHAAAVRSVEGAGRQSSESVADKLSRAPIRLKHGQGKTPMEYLREYTFRDDRHAGALFAEYAAAIAGRASLSWSRGLKALYQIAEPTPEEDKRSLASMVPDEVLLTVITPSEWRAVLRGSPLTRGKLLEYARKLDLQGLRQRIDELVAMHPPQAGP